MSGSRRSLQSVIGAAATIREDKKKTALFRFFYFKAASAASKTRVWARTGPNQDETRAPASLVFFTCCTLNSRAHAFKNHRLLAR